MIWRIILFLIAIATTTHLYADEHYSYGLKFNSYDKNKDERTSFEFPAQSSPIRFSRMAAIDVDVMIEQNADHFGYLCRIVINDTTSFDLLLNNPPGDIPFIALIHNNEQLSRISNMGEPASLFDWNRIRIEMRLKDKKLSVFQNGKEAANSIYVGTKPKIVVYFGLNNTLRFSTSDVAPMTIKDISIEVDQRKYFWGLDKYNADGYIADEINGAFAKATNPTWLIDRHIKWQFIKTLDFHSKAQIITDASSPRIFFLTKDKITEYNLLSSEQTIYPFSDEIQLSRVNTQFIYDHLHNKITYYEFSGEGEKTISYFDLRACKWSKPIVRGSTYAFLHNSSFISPLDSSIVQLFGYGLHIYSSDLFRITPHGEFYRSDIKTTIPPRYMSATGIADSTLYIYGGVGNRLGRQEYGITIYDDLYAMNLLDYTFRRLWSRDSINREVVACDLLADKEHKNLIGLFYNPNKYSSNLQLKQISIDNGHKRALADSIPYYFSDIDSDARLIYLSESKELCAVTMHKLESGHYQANIYSVKTPPLAFYEVLQTRAKESTLILWIVVGAASLLASAGLYMFIRKKRRSKGAPFGIDEKSIEDMIAARQVRTTSGIYIIDGFRIINSSGEDIACEFTPLMRQLLIVIILYTAKNDKGVSNDELKEILWFDKSDESARNNRGVTIRRIRLLLAEVGKFEIESKNQCWRLTMSGEDYCDYIDSLVQIERVRAYTYISISDFACLMAIAKKGIVLSDSHFDWLDSFKSDYTDKVINMLYSLMAMEQFGGDNSVKMLIADTILIFDTLDQKAVKIKCSSLISLGRVGVAKTCYDNFKREYEHIMGEPVTFAFDKFIKNEIINE